MIKQILKILMLFLISILPELKAQTSDEVITYWLKPVEIQTSRINPGISSFSLRNDKLDNVLKEDGFNLIRRGNFITQDIYSDGFKRADICVVIDGERYHSACPNRMDSPLTRVNPLLVQKVTLNKTSNKLQSNLGGIVSYERIKPLTELNLKSNLTISSGASQNADISFVGDLSEQQLNARFIKGKPYEDANGNTFKDLYGYKDNFDYMLAEGGLRGLISKDFSYNVAYTYSENVSFPYLKMDEIRNEVFNGSVEYKNNKLYLNYTSHLMDNSLRVSPTLMTTDATNLTAGIVGDFYEVIYRDWDLNNRFVMMNGTIDNHMIPNLSNILVTGNHLLEFENLTLTGKLGLEFILVGDDSRLDFYKQLYSDVNDSRTFINFGAAASYIFRISDNSNIGAMAEFAGNAPELQTLYIGVKKPTGKPTWIGNPDLKEPIRSTLRLAYNHSLFNFELFGNYITNYVNLTKVVQSSSAKFMTYENVNATILGFNFNFTYNIVKLDVSYNYGVNNSSDKVLAEIQPFKATVTLQSPDYYNFTSYIRNTFNAEQNRVDELLNETTTPSWNKFDLGIQYKYNLLKFSFEVENLFNEQYYQHLSYQRDPFASGATVYEPGRIILVSVMYGL